MQNILKVFSSKDGYKKADEFYLGNKSIWTFGKKVDKNIPDVLLFSSFPELQGKLVCEDGFWFYLNYDHSTRSLSQSEKNYNLLFMLQQVYLLHCFIKRFIVSTFFSHIIFEDYVADTRPQLL